MMSSGHNVSAFVYCQCDLKVVRYTNCLWLSAKTGYLQIRHNVPLITEGEMTGLTLQCHPPLINRSMSAGRGLLAGS